MNTIEQLSDMQKQYMDDDVYTAERTRIHESWFNETTTDFWRHKRMYETIQPFASYYTDARWLTVGDGRFGLDSIRLKKLFGLVSVFPTDIGENMLKISKQKGLIEGYGVENAEQLSFSDNSFDVVFCKESFHHFPRPFLALYEMLRVGRKAVVLIEPAERLVSKGVKSKPYLYSAFRLLFAKLTRRAHLPYVPEVLDLQHTHETSGNYLYAVSIREMEKLAHGMNLGGLAWMGFNDVYEKGCEFEEAKAGMPLYEKIRNRIAQGNKNCKTHPQFCQPNMVSVILFKEEPAPELIPQLKEVGFHLPTICKNPYL
jgi:ubiquinone/menaquinone biosynthesis C-methylase UbiE